MNTAQENINETNSKKTKGGSFLKYLLDGSVLTRSWFLEQMPFLIFLTILGVIYIGNRYDAEKTVRETASMQKEINDLRSESITIASELMQLSKQSEVTRLLEAQGIELKEATKPPVKIKIQTKTE